MAWVSSDNQLAGLAAMAGAAAIEYVFPPFPGDTITLLGAVLIAVGGWPFPAVFGALMLGSVVGSMAAFFLGSKLEPRRRGATGRLVERFRRHGAAYLVLNRFVPGVRALFFVAAGIAGMKPWKVAVYSALSAALWNLGLLALGTAVGHNLATLERWVRLYSTAFLILLGALALALLGRWLWKRHNTRKVPGE